MQNKALLKEIDRGLPGSLYYLWSEEGCFLDEALSRIIAVVVEAHSADFNYDVFDASAGAQDVINAAMTLPFMTQRRLVVLRDFHQFPAAAVKSLAPYFKKPAETTCMVVLSLKQPKAAWKADWKSYSLNIHERDVPAWLKGIASAKGIALTDEAVDYLIDFVGNDIGLLLMEVEKLSLSGQKTITGGDIAASTSVTRTFTAFDLIDALIAGKKTRAFRILRAMSSRNAMEAPVILGTLNWHYKQFYSLWMNRGRRPGRMRETTFRSLVKYVPAFSEGDFYDIFKHLHDADVEIKTSGRPALSLEVLLMKLLRKGTVN